MKFCIAVKLYGQCGVTVKLTASTLGLSSDAEHHCTALHCTLYTAKNTDRDLDGSYTLAVTCDNIELKPNEVFSFFT